MPYLDALPVAPPRPQDAEFRAPHPDGLDRGRSAPFPTFPPSVKQSGSFSIVGSRLVVPGASEETSEETGNDGPVVDQDSTGQRDTQIFDDLVVYGNACVGLDCFDQESFGFDTIRLKLCTKACLSCRRSSMPSKMQGRTTRLEGPPETLTACIESPRDRPSDGPAFVPGKCR